MTQNMADDVDQQWPMAEAGGTMTAAAVREGEDRDLTMTVTSDHGTHLTDLETVILTIESQFATSGRTATVIEAIDQAAAVGVGLPFELMTETVTETEIEIEIVIEQIGTGIETETGIGIGDQTVTETVYEMTGIEMMTAVGIVVGTEVAIVVGIDRPMIVIVGDIVTILAHLHAHAHLIGIEIVTGTGKETGKEIGFEIGTDPETDPETETVNGNESATGIGIETGIGIGPRRETETEIENETETGLAIVTVTVIGQRRTTIVNETVTATAIEIGIAAGTGKENLLFHRAVVPVLDGTLQACSTSTATSHLPAIEAVLRVDGCGPQSALMSGLVASSR